MKELEFIEIIKQTICDSSYIGNDTAYIKERNIIATKDILVEDVHFRLETICPFDLGLKAISVNLSDIAAASALPEFLIIGLALPKSIDKNFIQEFYKGADFLAQRYNVKIIGGDITSSEKLIISVTAIGKIITQSITGRDFAKEGQVVVITGESGNSKAGLEILENKLDIDNKIKVFFTKAHTTPMPRINEGIKMAKACEENFALMDTSDGLADALFKVAKASNVSLKIDYDSIPINENLEKIATMVEKQPKDFIFFGGEDYELLACLPEKVYNQLLDEKMPIYKIGEVIKKEENTPVVVYSKNKKLFSIINLESTFDHFG